jgi:uncharacterized protein YrrD
MEHREESQQGNGRDNYRGNVFVSPQTEKSVEHSSQDFIGKTIINVEDGRRIGSVSDILIDRETLEVAAIELSRGNLFNRETSAIRAEDIQVWGEDVILVRSGDSVTGSENIPQREKWLKVSEHIRGRYVVSVDGTRIGQVNGLMLDQRGRILAYELNQVFIDGPLNRSKRISADATHSLGQDVLVVNTVEGLNRTEEHEQRDRP